MFKLMKNLVKLFLYLIYVLLTKIIKVNSRKIIFISYYGTNFSCNPRAIFEALIKSNKVNNFEYIIVTNNKLENNYENIKIKFIKYKSITFLYHLCSSKYWIVNSHYFLS